MDTPSAKMSLNSLDKKSIAFGALDALVGALSTYVITLLPQIELGVWTPMIMWAATTGFKALRKYLADGTIPEVDKKK